MRTATPDCAWMSGRGNAATASAAATRTAPTTTGATSHSPSTGAKTDEISCAPVCLTGRIRLCRTRNWVWLSLDIDTTSWYSIETGNRPCRGVEVCKVNAVNVLSLCLVLLVGTAATGCGVSDLSDEVIVYCSGDLKRLGKECRSVYEQIVSCCADEDIGKLIANEVVCGLHAEESMCKPSAAVSIESACEVLSTTEGC